MLEARRPIRPLNSSGSRAHLYECAQPGQPEGDEKKYVVKLLGNPQGERALATEWIAANLARRLELPIPDFDLVNVPSILLPPVNPQQPYNGFRAGTAWASSFVETAEDCVLANDVPKLINPEKALDIMVFDHWVFNWDRAHRHDNIKINRTSSGIELLMIDHSICFCGPSGHPWSVHTMESNKHVANYQYVGTVFDQFSSLITGTNPFKNSIDKILSLTLHDVAECIQSVPADWGVAEDEKRLLADFLVHRATLLETVMNNSKSRYAGWQ